MLERIPAGVGRALRRVRAGYEKIVSENERFSVVPQTMVLQSPAFRDGGRLPSRHTDDGEGVSPALRWSRVPPDARSLVLIVEDPDAPAPAPLVHLLAWDLPADSDGLEEGCFASPHHPGQQAGVGRNAYTRVGWLPPDPPKGHGPHLYVFQLFALDRRLGFSDHPGRPTLEAAMEGRVLARGVLIGAYERR